MRPSVNVQGGYKLMRLRSMKNINRKYWDMIPMPDTVIDEVDILGKDKTQLLVFNDHKGRLIEDVDVELTGLDGDGDEKYSPLKT